MFGSVANFGIILGSARAARLERQSFSNGRTAVHAQHTDSARSPRRPDPREEYLSGVSRRRLFRARRDGPRRRAARPGHHRRSKPKSQGTLSFSALGVAPAPEQLGAARSGWLARFRVPVPSVTKGWHGKPAEGTLTTPLRREVAATVFLMIDTGPVRSESLSHL